MLPTTGNQEQSRETLLRYNQELQGVNELAEALSLGHGIEAVIATALQRTIALMDAEVGAIYLLDPQNETFKLKASQGNIPADLELILNSPAQPFQCLLESGHPIVIENLRNAAQPLFAIVQVLEREGFTSWACAPLKVEGKIIGVYQLGKLARRSFNDHDIALLEVIGNVVGASLSNAQLLVDLRHKETELRRALRRSVELQEEERKRLARELHDEIGQALTSILIRLKTISEDKNQAGMHERMNDLRNLTAQTIEELRRLAMDLRPSALDNLGIVPALRWYIKQCAERTGLDIVFLEPELPGRLSPEIELTLYRVAQEGLTNAIRHGRASKIVVLLERDIEQNKIHLSITDNGVGFNHASMDRGLGLVGMQERVELLNGKLLVETDPGAGTMLRVEIPFKR